MKLQQISQFHFRDGGRCAARSRQSNRQAHIHPHHRRPNQRGRHRRRMDGQQRPRCCHRRSMVWSHNVPPPVFFTFIPTPPFSRYPGQEGGTAVADVLLGRANPSGRLPVTVYLDRYATIQVIFHLFASSSCLYIVVRDCHVPQPMHSMDMISPPGRSYRYATDGVLFPFGYGLSYTTFRYDSFTVAPVLSGRHAGFNANASVVITNTGPM
jgi:hypothetical protein